MRLVILLIVALTTGCSVTVRELCKDSVGPRTEGAVMLLAGVVEAAFGAAILLDPARSSSESESMNVVKGIGEGTGEALGAGAVVTWFGIEGLGMMAVGITQIVKGRRVFHSEQPVRAPRACVKSTTVLVFERFEITVPCGVAVKTSRDRVWIDIQRDGYRGLFVIREPITDEPTIVRSLIEARHSERDVTRDDDDWIEYTRLDHGQETYGLWMRMDVDGRSFACTTEEHPMTFASEVARDTAIGICRSLTRR